VACYALPMVEKVKVRRRRGTTRVSSKNQVTLPIDALDQAGLRTGDRLRAEVRSAGEITLVRMADPVDEFAGALTGKYPQGYLDELRREWP
jgi:bifunctional DNA-binding transcriptional regulator/antitoxin component of YhaV-PrlF toxin-antitoxin module